MGKAHSNQKGPIMKNQNPFDANTQDSGAGRNNLDVNQSARSMSGGSDDNFEGEAREVDPISAMDNEGGAMQPVEAHDVEGENLSQSSGRDDSASEGGLASKAASLMDGRAVKKNLNLVKHKAQDFMASSKEQISGRFNSLSDDVKQRGLRADQSIKSNPYAYALGAVGIGFILGRAFSGKGKGDLDTLVSTVNKLNLKTLTGLFGAKSASEATEQPDYNEDQARKIG